MANTRKDIRKYRALPHEVPGEENYKLVVEAVAGARAKSTDFASVKEVELFDSYCLELILGVKARSRQAPLGIVGAQELVTRILWLVLEKENGKP